MSLRPSSSIMSLCVPMVSQPSMGDYAMQPHNSCGPYQDCETLRARSRQEGTTMTCTVNGVASKHPRTACHPMLGKLLGIRTTCMVSCRSDRLLPAGPATIIVPLRAPAADHRRSSAATPPRIWSIRQRVPALRSGTALNASQVLQPLPPRPTLPCMAIPSVVRARRPPDGPSPNGGCNTSCSL